MFAAEDVVTVSSHAAGWHAGDFKLPVISLIVFPLRGLSSLNSSISPYYSMSFLILTSLKYSRSQAATQVESAPPFFDSFYYLQFESNKISSKKLFLRQELKLSLMISKKILFLQNKHITICNIKNITTGKSIKSKNTYKANVCRQQKLRQSSLLNTDRSWSMLS